MLTTYVVRGIKAGSIAGFAFGAYIAFVMNPLIAYAETYEETSHGSGPVVSNFITTTISVLGGILTGILLGAVVFGLTYYFLEPALPGTYRVKSFVFAAAGFITVSVSPWLVLPPQPPGIEQSLPTETRIAWYIIMMVAGALACGIAGSTYHRLKPRDNRILTVTGLIIPFVLLLVIASFGPPNQTSGTLPPTLVEVYRSIVITGQIGFWTILATIHTWLVGRNQRGDSRDPQNKLRENLTKDSLG